MTLTILGLDPGLARLGFGRLRCPAPGTGTPGAIQVLDFGTIETLAGGALGDRLATIYDDLQELLREIRPDLVALEKLFFYRMANTIAVAQARGVVVLAIAQAGLPYVEFTPPRSSRPSPATAMPKNQRCRPRSPENCPSLRSRSRTTPPMPSRWPSQPGYKPRERASGRPSS